MVDGFVPIFRPAGAGSRAGAVPDPGTNPSDYVLRADATWGPGATSGAFSQSQLVALQIGVGAASATAFAPFAPTFGGTPYVQVSGNDNQWTWAAKDIGPTGCTIEGMVAIAASSTLSATGTVSAFFY